MKNTKLKIIFFFSFVIAMTIFLSPNLVKAEETDKYDILSTNFRTSLTELETSPYMDIETDLSGMEIIEPIENLGIVDTIDNQVIFKSILTARIDVNFYTDYLLGEIFRYRSGLFTYKNVNPSDPLTSGTTWLTLRTADNWFWTTYNNLEVTEYKVDYHYYKLEELIAQGYRGNFQMNFEFVNFEDHILETEFANSTAELSVGKVDLTAMQVKSIAHKVEELTDYQDQFSEANQVTFGATRIDQNPANDGDMGSASGDIKEKIADLDLGIESPSTPENITAQQRNVIPLTDGRVIDKTGVNQYQFPITNIPEVIKFRQSLEIRKAEIHADIVGLGSGIQYVSPVQIVRPERYVGFRVNNWVIQQTFEIKFACFSTVELDPIYKEQILSMPEFYQGDMIWDLSLFGDVGGSLVFTEPPNVLLEFFSGLQGILRGALILIAMVLAGFALVKFGFPMIARAKAPNGQQWKKFKNGIKKRQIKFRKK